MNKKDTVLIGNKLIAEFMGYKYIPFNNENELKPGWWKNPITRGQQDNEHNRRKIGKSRFLVRRHPELRYYNEWNWLIPVVQKINNIETDINSDLYMKQIDVVCCNLTESMKTVFQFVVNFIKFYNEHKESN